MGSDYLNIQYTKAAVKEDDDIATPDDIISHELAQKEYAAGETISHDMIDWN